MTQSKVLTGNTSLHKYLDRHVNNPTHIFCALTQVSSYQPSHLIITFFNFFKDIRDYILWALPSHPTHLSTNIINGSNLKEFEKIPLVTQTRIFPYPNALDIDIKLKVITYAQYFYVFACLIRGFIISRKIEMFFLNFLSWHEEASINVYQTSFFDGSHTIENK